jgi:hypothetical protein
MSRKTIAELRAYLKQETEKKTGDFTQNREIYPFWNMPVGSVARIRILPDANEDNPRTFYEYKYNHNLIIKGKKRNVQCLSQYGEKCPICELSRAFYKEQGKESKEGKFFYRKKSALVSILVLDDPLPPDPETGETYKGKVTKTILGNQLLTKMLSSITDVLEPMENDPWDFDKGYDFFIKKGQSGSHATYDVESKFATRSSPIPAEYRESIQLVDLASCLAPNPGFEKIEALLNNHLHGSDIEDEAGIEKDSEVETPAHVNSAPAQAAAPAAKVTKPVVDAETPAEPALSELELIANIKNRFKKAG